MDGGTLDPELLRRRDLARQAFAAEMADRQLNPYEVAAEAKVDPDTVRDFIDGRRWPKIRTQGRLEKWAGWAAGTIRAVERGAQPPPLHSALTAQEIAAKVPGLSQSTRDDLILRILQADERTVQALSQVLDVMGGSNGTGS